MLTPLPEPLPQKAGASIPPPSEAMGSTLGCNAHRSGLQTPEASARTTAVAGWVVTRNNFLSCSQKCKCCPAPTPTPSGDAHRRRLAALAAPGSRPGNPVLNVVEMGIVRRRRCPDQNAGRSQNHTHLHGVPCHGCHRRRHPRATDTLGLRRRPRLNVELVYAPAWTTDWLSEAPRTSSKLTASLLQERPPTNGHSRAKHPQSGVPNAKARPLNWSACSAPPLAKRITAATTAPSLSTTSSASEVKNWASAISPRHMPTTPVHRPESAVVWNAQKER